VSSRNHLGAQIQRSSKQWRVQKGHL
jgi:hypothetical protein